MWPLDGDAQPVVARAPAAWTDEHVVLVFVEETTVDLLYLVGNLRIVDSRKVVVGLDINHVDDILGDAVTQRVVRAQQTLLIGNGGEVFVEHLLGVNNGTYLEQIELSSHTMPLAPCSLLLV